ncbi:MAG: cation:proton antiporter [Chitinivibrionales bacterium]|nr:cation:proton antiporter [Chitinivibrionales bacterium]
MIVNVMFRMSIWFLLTADLGLSNVVLGILLAVLLPGKIISKTRLRDWMIILGRLLIAVPLAYGEAFHMLFLPHTHEEVVEEPVDAARPLPLVFLEIFLITFTPQSLVYRYHESGKFDIHLVSREKSGE